ncbi:MAG: arylsulfatase [Planctomycetota bacterium]|nr:MAG: arylsulfatase [Planctomycetota bacterium]
MARAGAEENEGRFYRRRCAARIGAKWLWLVVAWAAWFSGIRAAVTVAAEQPTVARPNIVLVLADDLGYGDVHALAPQTSKIPTPNMDRLTREGMVFTDAHSGASVCTPTRYGLLTGRYCWRTRLQSGVVTGFAPSLIAADRPTVATFLKRHGYYTAAVGKWHLNCQYLDPETRRPLQRKQYKLPPIGAIIPDGPIHRGFDYFHGFHHARDMKAVIENDRVIAHDDVVHMLPRIARKTVELIRQCATKPRPFFLYVPLSAPHTPIVPTARWLGRSGLNKYGDFVMQVDDVVGQIVDAIDAAGLRERTLLIVTSDNGCSKAAGITELAAKGHLVSDGFRGSKADIWDGGHRVPFIVRWPGVVRPGSRSDELICLNDVFATVCDILGVSPPPRSCEDSVSFLPALRGRPVPEQRSGIVHHSSSGHFAYRTKRWKLILARGSGGWTSPREHEVPPGTPEAQLYDMLADPGEQRNLYEEQPEVARRLLELLERDVRRGRSTDGPPAKNDVNNIVLWKSGRGPAPARPAGKKRRRKRSANGGSVRDAE